MGGVIFSQVQPVLRARLAGEGVRRLQGFKCLEDSGFDNVSMGTRPSGVLHQGNLFVLASCMHYLRINSKATVHVDIMDLDFDNQRGSVFTPFVSLPTTRDFIKQLQVAVEIMATALHVDADKVKLTYFSERLKGVNSELREMFLRLFKTRDAVKALKFSISHQRGRYDVPPISLICESCGQSSGNFARYNATRDRFTATCGNLNCTVQDYESDLFSALFNIHYLVDPARDLLLGPRTLHVFGGDYGVNHGKVETPRFLSVAAAMEAARIYLDLEPEIPSFFITPLITDRHGAKISKSQGNGGTVQADLATHLREEISQVIKIMGLCIDGTLTGFNLVRPQEDPHDSST